ncbi:ATP-grasp domain-containing protein [Pseudoalteromonas luteoviolacea]|uniref:ATP-grasp domain-containing protein n=1 Tax=Pseudoalteromonas luteoviolacea TaxID=43657 RepID=UPI001B3A20B3|nr:ATP-grasp domain-containing protein [Pseudoalteromonas luteoviolacea]MBQ4878189.1 ATP-grasp domain-containing protein [Pseudoalteromonas luteoviolacea]MBQ4907344.1 ATP-grasp domain-containing protein [Pseudoalteromonas luteoviolacea]
MEKYFIQVGAGRDWLDPYASIAKSTHYKTVLLETAEYLDLRRTMSTVSFNYEIIINHDDSPEKIAELLLEKFGNNIALVLAGFEIYNERAFAIAASVGSFPTDVNTQFVCPDKGKQRELLSSSVSSIKQPNYFHVSSLTELANISDQLTFPVVLKPTNAGGGLGVHLIADRNHFESATEHFKQLRNYGGNAFTGFIVEDFVDGQELSLQGICLEKSAEVLSVATKTVLKQTDSLGVSGFRECGHVVSTVHPDIALFKRYAQELCDIFKYQRGAFHIDLMKKDDKYYFIEMGFRFSGMGLEKLVSDFYHSSWTQMAWLSSLGMKVNIEKKAAQHAKARLTIRDPQVLHRAKKLCIDNSHLNLTLNKHKATPNDDATLRSDQMRHGGVLGVLSFDTAQHQQAQKILEHCCFNHQHGVITECAE